MFSSKRWIWGLIFCLPIEQGTRAWAGPLPPGIEEIPDPNPPSFQLSTPPQYLHLGPLGITDGLLILDTIVNIGKQLWDLVAKGKPVADYTTDEASAVPKGVGSWAELESWSDPVVKLYHAKTLGSNGRENGDYYFRVIYAFGGGAGGKGKYLAGVSALPAQIELGYAHSFNSRVNVLAIVNHGTDQEPIAGMLLHLQWGFNAWFWHTEQSVEIHVRGDGKLELLTTGDEGKAIDIGAPSLK
jgi:hypothetical protein